MYMNGFLRYFSSNFSSILKYQIFFTKRYLHTLDSSIPFDINYIYATKKIQISEFKTYRTTRLFPLIFYNLCLEKYFSLSFKKKNKESKYNKIIKETKINLPLYIYCNM